MLTFTLKRCDQTDEENDCADDEELEEYVDRHRMFLFADRTFVDYENVEPRVGPIGHAIEQISSFKLSY